MVFDDKVVEVLSFQRRGVQFTREVVEVTAPNAIAARPKARAIVRSRHPDTIDIFNIENVENMGSIQTRFSTLFPESIRRKTFRVVVKFEQ